MDNRFPAACRLRNKKDIQAVFAQRDVFRGERLVFYRGPSPAPGNMKSRGDQLAAGREDCSRFCLTVSKKCGRAVRRNRIKRVLREIIRNNSHRIAPGYDYIIRVSGDRLTGTVGKKDFLGDFEQYFGWH